MGHTSESPVILWFRRDLRISDHPALHHAATSPIIPLFIWDDKDPHNPGGAARWWLHKSLISLQKSLSAYGLDLILRRGDPLTILQDIVDSHNVAGLYWSRCYEPYTIQRDQQIKEFFKPRIQCESFNSSLLVEPWTLKTQSGSIYRRFTPYWTALKALGHFGAPLGLPHILRGYNEHLLSEDLESWNLHPTHPDWSYGFAKEWTPGELGAQKNLAEFLEQHLHSYRKNRDFPNLRATSKLSPHLHWGEISPRQIWHGTLVGHIEKDSEDAWSFLSEVGWREFSYYLLYHFPELAQKPLRPSFTHFPWNENPGALAFWQKGLTGYPIVDAGMRQLWQTGWMHNRVRMIAASFLVKDLLIPWQKGADWFLDTLVDADLASNSTNWQWVAGCGVDAAPYFRIFNPVLQGQKFDPQGKYVRRWVPELAMLPDEYIHNPWEAPSPLLESAGITIGQTYPSPLVDHGKARRHALAAYELTKEFR